MRRSDPVVAAVVPVKIPVTTGDVIAASEAEQSRRAVDPAPAALHFQKIADRRLIQHHRALVRMRGVLGPILFVAEQRVKADLLQNLLKYARVGNRDLN